MFCPEMARSKRGVVVAMSRSAPRLTGTEFTLRRWRRCHFEVVQAPRLLSRLRVSMVCLLRPSFVALRGNLWFISGVVCSPVGAFGLLSVPIERAGWDSTLGVGAFGSLLSFFSVRRSVGTSCWRHVLSSHMVKSALRSACSGAPLGRVGCSLSAARRLFVKAEGCSLAHRLLAMSACDPSPRAGW